ncbi:hypothetical protein JOQ06_021816 [Pogonophryne albipinna]|uniref:Uncharacterized protein n=1 Tax=Pogonophryne albipinna TaxID=1090488 RepID=A0AAD6A796_9TELE|nr:hypothetical protein JOQ06_021816 [Pogonophryne albipinna]
MDEQQDTIKHTSPPRAESSELAGLRRVAVPLRRLSIVAGERGGEQQRKEKNIWPIMGDGALEMLEPQIGCPLTFGGIND